MISHDLIQDLIAAIIAVLAAIVVYWIENRKSKSPGGASKEK